MLKASSGLLSGAEAVRLGLLVLAVALAGLGIVSLLAMPLHQDTGWYLYAARQVLGGARPYVDVVDANPPLILFLLVPVELLARATKGSDVLIFYGFVLGLAGFSLYLSSTLLRRLAPEAGSVRGYLLVVVVFLLIGFPGFEFGQREHLMLMFVLPYFLAAAGRSAGVDLPAGAAWGIGAFAGLGFAFKPFFPPIWLALVALVALRRGRRSWLFPENLGVLAVLAAFGLAVLAFTPGYFRIAAWTVEVYREFFRAHPLALIRSRGMLLAVLALAIHLAAPRRRGVGLDELRRVLVLALVLFLGILWYQGKGWAYHWQPVEACAVLVLALAGTSWYLAARTEPLRRALRVGAGLAGALMLIAAASNLARAEAEWDRLRGGPSFLSDLWRLVDELAPGGSVYALTTTPSVGFPLVNYAGVDWAGRFNSLWMLTGLYSDPSRYGRPFRYRERSEMSELERYTVDAVVEDLERRRPALLIIDRTAPGYAATGFRYREYFMREARFRAALERYRLAAAVGWYYVYALEPPVSRSSPAPAAAPRSD